MKERGALSLSIDSFARRSKQNNYQWHLENKKKRARERFLKIKSYSRLKKKEGCIVEEPALKRARKEPSGSSLDKAIESNKRRIEFKESLEQKKQAREDKLKQDAIKRRMQSRKVNQRTKKGQPVMKNMMERLLEKIEKQ